MDCHALRHDPQDDPATSQSSRVDAAVFPRHLLLTAYDSWARLYSYPAAYKFAVLEGTEKLTFGSALFAAASIARGQPQKPPVDPDTFPSFSEALTRNPFDDEALFAETLRIYLAGVNTRIARGEMGQPFTRRAPA